MKTEITIKFTVDAAEPKARQAAVDWALRTLLAQNTKALQEPGVLPFRGNVTGAEPGVKVATYAGAVEVREAPEMLALPVIDPGMVPQSTEQAIVAAGANVAPRVTPERIAGLIDGEHYFTAWEGAQLAYWGDSDPANPKPSEGQPDKDGPLGLLTFCVLVLRNGFTVTGESACASPENFNAEIGRRIARENAVAKIWPLEGYLLRQRLHEGVVS